MSEEVIQLETVTRDLENYFSWARQSLFLFLDVSLGVSLTLIKTIWTYKNIYNN